MQPQRHYEIAVDGVLDRDCSAWFDSRKVTSESAGRTPITGRVAETSARPCRCAVSTRVEPCEAQVVMPLARRRLLTASGCATRPGRSGIAIAESPR